MFNGEFEFALLGDGTAVCESNANPGDLGANIGARVDSDVFCSAGDGDLVVGDLGGDNRLRGGRRGEGDNAGKGKMFLDESFAGRRGESCSSS